VPEDLSDLADGLEDRERAARLALIERLVDRGCTPEEIRDAHARGRLTLLPLELTVPLDALVTINRVVGRAMATIASAARDTMETLLAQTDVDESVRALRAAEATEALLPDFEQVLVYALGEHVRELVRLEAGTRLARAGEPDVREVGIAFADLVDFTGLGDRLAPNELAEVAERFESLAFEALEPGVSVVKTIGDEVMLASPDPPALVASVLALIRTADHSDLPPIRAGAAAGPARHRAATGTDARSTSRAASPRWRSRAR